MEKFTLEVCEKLQHYVYRLIDPRTGETFYVGRGHGNRVFDHVNSTVNNIKITCSEYEDVVSEKIDQITSIINSNLNVLHIIHRHGMDEVTAAEVEAALIDAYPGLTNINRGSGCSSFGIMNVQQIQELYGLEQLDSFKHKVMFIKINKSFLDGGSIYDATRFAWKISLANATKVDYVLAVYRGVIKEVFKVDEWKTATRINFPEFNLEYVDRFGFVGYSAEKEIQDLYKNKRIPDGYQKKGSTNPIQYSK
jgi:hypothetical protein